MNRWLFKTDPDTYSWNDLKSKSKDVWNGVANPLALKYLRTVRTKDQILIYHTGDDKAVVGIAEAVSDSYPDPNENDPKLVAVDVKATQALKKSVPLAMIKTNPQLKSWELVRMSRLSVMPVASEQWNEVLKLSRNI